MPLNAAYADEIVQEDNSTYQLTFRFPTSDSLWEQLKEETFLTADDLHGEQDFVIFEVEKKHGYIQVYANQVFTLLNNYVVSSLALDRATGSTALSRFAGSITRDNPFSFFSDIEDRHTFNVGSKNAMEAFAKDKHSIIGQWGGDLVRHGYQVRLLKNGGSENESLFMYKKNLSSYQHKTSTKSLKTRITFTTTVKGEGEKAPDRTFTVTIDSPLINKYSQIYEDVIEVNDQDVKDEASLRKYGEQYFKTSLCDMMEDSLELEVVGQSDVPVQMFDIVSLFHEVYNLDVRKKITKYTYSPMGKKLKTIGFGQFKSGLANAIGNAVSDAVKGEAQQLQGNFERQLARELKNAGLAFDRQKEELVNQFTDGLNAAKAKAEEVKRELSDTIDQRFNSFNSGPLQEAKRRAEEALRNAGASTLLAQEAKRIGLDSIARLEAFKSQATSAQTALSGDLDVLKRTITNDIRPKQAQAEAEIAKQVEALIQTKKELAGIKSAQATYEETTTRRLSELTNLANGKASKSELTQTAEELASRIASAQAGSSRNYFRNSRSRTFTTGDQAVYDYRTFIVPDFWKNRDRLKRDYVRLSFDATFPVALARDTQANVHFSASPWYSYQLTFKGGTTERQHFEFTIDLSSSSETYQTNNVFIRFGTNYGFPAVLQVVIENAMLSVGNYFPAYQSAYEDQEDRVSVVESNFKQRADSLDAGVNRLSEGLRTKADISSLNVTAENIRQSVKSLETDTQNKLNQKLNLAEFEVRAGSIRQEILNATKDKADKTLVIAEAGKIREELSSLSVGGTNLLAYVNFKVGGYYQNSFKRDLKYTYSNLIEVKSTDYLLQIWELEPNAKKLWAGLQLFDEHQNPIANGYSTFWFNGHLKQVIKPPNNAKYLAISFENRILDKDKAKFKLEMGTIPTDWSPAPEDTDGLITEAKATFERTAQGLRTDLSSIQEYVGQDGQRQEALQRYTREESAKQATAVRELVNRDFVGKASYQEDVRGIERKFEAITNPQNGSIATQIAKYKTAVDGRFTEITSMISGKASQADFQRVRETSQLYERILGNTNNSIVDNVARMAMTNQLFQVEVSKAAKGGRNYIRNGQFKNGSKNWLEYQSVNFGLNFNYQHSKNPDNRNRPGLHFYHESQDVANFFGIQQSIAFDGVRGEKVSVSLLVSKDGGDVNSGLRVALHYIKNKNIVGQEWQSIPSPQINSKYKRFTFTFTLSDDVENLNLMLYGEKGKTIDLYVTDVQLERGSVATDYKEAPEDTDEAIRTVQSQLAGSWSVQNINSAGDLISGVNFGANGHNRLDGKLTHITGETLIDKAVIKSAMVDKLKTANFEAGSVTTVVLDAEAVTAEKLKVDQAFFNKLVANEAYLSQLFAKQAFINRVQSVTLDASQIKTGVLTGGRIQGGTITGSSISGGVITGSSISGSTLTGRTKIQLGTYGSFETVNGGLQINVPRTTNSKDGLGVQFIGSYGRGEDVPYGLFIYKDPDITVGSTASKSDDFLLTVEGYINAKGIGWLRTGKSSVNNKLTATLGLWNSNNVSLEFGGSGNDIYYSYNGTAYSLWSVINQHFSDRRLKENIVDCKHKALDYIHQFQFKEYDWKKQEDRPQQAHTKIGLIAQEVQEVDSTLVYENGDTLNLDNLRLTNIALKAIQELALENKKLTQRLEKLENERRTA
jgi:phage minor structural protein